MSALLDMLATIGAGVQVWHLATELFEAEIDGDAPDEMSDAYDAAFRRTTEAGLTPRSDAFWRHTRLMANAMHGTVTIH